MHNIFIWIPSTHTHMHTHSNGMCYRFSNMCCLCSLAKKWTKTNEKSVASQYIETQSELKCKISMSIIYHDIQNYRNIALPSCPSLLPKLHVSTCMNCGHHQNCYQMFDAKRFLIHHLSLHHNLQPSTSLVEKSMWCLLFGWLLSGEYNCKCSFVVNTISLTEKSEITYMFHSFAFIL